MVLSSYNTCIDSMGRRNNNNNIQIETKKKEVNLIYLISYDGLFQHYAEDIALTSLEEDGSFSTHSIVPS